jgi:hypothetical protein
MITNKRPKGQVIWGTYIPGFSSIAPSMTKGVTFCRFSEFDLCDLEK